MNGVRGAVWFWTVMMVIGLVTNGDAPATAQIADAGIHFDVGAPREEFKDNLDRNGYGASITGVVHPGTELIGFGLELGFLNYGHESRTEPLSATIPDVRVRVTNSNNIVLGHLLVRLQRSFGPVAPYVDGLVGFHYLYTDSKIENLRGDEEIASSVNLDDATSSYGLGGGMMIRLVDIDLDEPKLETLGISLDFKVRYLRGGRAEYLKEGSISRSNGDISYNVRKSRTDMMLYQVGVMFNF